MLKDEQILILTNNTEINIRKAINEYKDKDASNSLFHFIDVCPIATENLINMPYGSIGHDMGHLRNKRIERASKEMARDNISLFKADWKYNMYDHIDYRKQEMKDLYNANLVLHGLCLTIADELDLDTAAFCDGMSPAWLNILKEEKATTEEVMWAQAEVASIKYFNQEEVEEIY